MIPVFAQDIGGGNGGQRLLRGLVAGLALSSLAFTVSLGAWLVAGGGNDARMADLQNRIAERRSELMNRHGPAAEEALKGLQARKWATPSAVVSSRSAVEDPARRRASDRIAHRGRQGADRRIGHRRACADSIDRAVAAVHPGYVLRAYGQGSKRRREFSHRGAYRTLIRRDELMRTSTHRLVIGRRQALAVVAYVCVVIALLAVSLLLVADLRDKASRDRSGSDAA